MTVLITRPIQDAKTTASALNLHKVSSILDPMTLVEFVNYPDINTSNIPHIIFTSKNGVRAFCQTCDARDFTAWCVGNETAKLAQEHGFQTCHSAQGDKDDLFALITKKIEPQPMLRVARIDQKDVLTQNLQSHSYPVTSLPLYRVISTSTLSGETTKALQQQEISNILFHSPKAARITVENIIQSTLTDACRKITAWCISKKTAEALDPIQFKEIVIAHRPNENDLLNPLIARIASNG